MENVIRLAARSNNEGTRSKLEKYCLTAKTSKSESNEKLIRAAAELSRQYDAIETVIETVEDAETRTRLKQSAKHSQETLLKTMLKLSHQIEPILLK